MIALTRSKITSTSLVTSTVDTTTILTTLDPSTTTTTSTTTVAPAEPTVEPECQGFFINSKRNDQQCQAGVIGLKLTSGRADGFNINSGRLQPASTIVRSATGQQGASYTSVFLETSEQQQASGNQALSCALVGNFPDLKCQLGSLDTFYQCPTVSPNALVLSTPENVAADPALMADCVSHPLFSSCQR